METIICSRCGKEIERPKGSRRTVCRECAKERTREYNRNTTKIRLQQEKESNAIKKAGREIEKRDRAALEAQKAQDAEIDARSRKQIQLQCRKCKYQLRVGSNNQLRCIGCDYVSHTGKLRDRGTGKAGECGSFVPMTTETKAERMARRKKALRLTEANNAQNTGEKMREVNQL